MEILALKKVIEQIEKNNKVALVTVLAVEGTTPCKPGMNMAICENYATTGTVGGGGVEIGITAEAINRLESGEDGHYSLIKENLKVDVFIKLFDSREKLLIVGSGHVGQELYKIATLQKFYTVIIDSREDLTDRDHFPEADEIHLGDAGEILKSYKIDEKTYIVACGPSHSHDEMTLRRCIDRGAKYIGMLGSRKKISSIKGHLLEEGISDESLDNIYAPIGINTGGDSVAEIAFGIFGEILSVKNNSQINHMKDMKK